MNERWEEICARLCLLTDAGTGYGEGRSPMTRAAVRDMIDKGILEALVLRQTQGVSEQRIELAEALLGRVRRVYALLEEYEAQGYKGMLPQDEHWPPELRKMGKKMPLFLFAKGNAELLTRDKIAIAGSRDIMPNTVKLAQRIGRQLAHEGVTMVSGGARGIDTAVQDAALSEGGSMILIPARAAHELLRRSTIRRALDDGRLLVLCDTLPDAPFTAAKALARNNIIYSLGAAALVLASRERRGGSWHGATDCMLAKWTPVYVTDDGGPDMAGNRLLLTCGAKRFDEGMLFRDLIDKIRRDHPQQISMLDI